MKTFIKIIFILIILLLSPHVKAVSDSKPVAKIEATPQVADIDSAFYFDASKSSGNNLLYRFDFQNDDIFEKEFSKDPKASYIYVSTGIKRVKVEVKDSNGNTDWNTITILVKSKDLKPKIKLNVVSPAGIASTKKAVIGTEVSFQVSVWDDKNRAGNMYLRFDFDGDSNYDTSFTKNTLIKYKFKTPGIKKVTVQAMDSADNLVEASITLEIVDNSPPTAFFKIDKVIGTEATEFKFDARSSYDNQSYDNSLKMRWDFESDGYYDTNFENSVYINHKYDSPGIKRITLQVIDLQGAIGNYSKEVEILANSKPNIVLKVTPSEGTFETRFTIDASGSFDGQTDQKNLKYRFDLDYQGENDLKYTNPNFFSNSKIVKNFNKIGTFTIKVEVQDENGEISTNYKKINIHWASPYVEFLKKNNVMQGYKDRNMQPERIITRAEFITMVMKAKKKNYQTIKYTEKYSDVGKKDWFAKSILIATDMGIVSGYRDGSFRPLNPITRGEAVTILMKAFEERGGGSRTPANFRDINSSSPYYSEIIEASKVGIISGYSDSTFKPNNQLKRGEAAKMLYEAMRRMRY